jgi:hypothetical protein
MPKRSSSPRPASPPKLAVALPAALLAIALLGGCGESSGGGSSASTSAAATAGATTAQSASTAPSSTAPAAKPHAPVRHGAGHGAAPSKAELQQHKREAFQSLANAKPAPKQTPAQRAASHVNDIVLRSPTISGGKLSSENTCHGAGRSPALRWSNVPSGTAEIAILTLSVTPVNGKLFYDWAVAGIPPSVREIPAGQLPAGAVAGRTGWGSTSYKICPAGHETYVFSIYALPRALRPGAGFDPAVFRTQALADAKHLGLLIATYR